MTSLSITQENSQMKNTKTKNIHIGSIFPVNGKEASKMFCKSLEAICELGFNVSILAEGDKSTQDCCFDLLEKYPEQFQILESIPKNKQIILKSVNSIIFTENPAKKDLAEVISNNVIPILPEGNGLQDFDLKQETGESFTFKKGNIWSFVSALVRANENFKFSYDWKTIKHNLEMIIF